MIWVTIASAFVTSQIYFWTRSQRRRTKRSGDVFPEPTERARSLRDLDEISRLNLALFLTTVPTSALLAYVDEVKLRLTGSWSPHQALFITVSCADLLFLFIGAALLVILKGARARGDREGGAIRAPYRDHSLRLRILGILVLAAGLLFYLILILPLFGVLAA